MSERERKAGEDEKKVERDRGEGGKTDSCRVIFFGAFVDDEDGKKEFPCCQFSFCRSLACRSQCTQSRKKSLSTFISHSMPQNLHIQLNSKIAVCSELSTVK